MTPSQKFVWAAVLAVGLVAGLKAAPEQPLSDPLAARARTALHEIVAKESGFARVHAIEVLIFFGGRDEMKRMLEREALMADSTSYRVGTWRALAWAAATPDERGRWTAQMERVVADPSAPDRAQAVEALCKLNQPMQGPALAAARERARTGPEVGRLMPQWALALAGDRKATGRIAQALASPDDRTRLIAAFCLGWMHANDPATRRALTAAADRAQPGTDSYPFLLSTAVALEADPARVAGWRQAFVRGVPRYTAEGLYDCCHVLLPTLTRADLAWLTPLLDSPESDTRVAGAWSILTILSPQP